MEKIGSTVDSPILSKGEEDFWVLNNKRFEVGLKTEEIEKMYQIVQKHEREQEEKRKVIHCQRCSHFNPPGTQNCESCDRDITGDPMIQMPK